MGDMPPLKTTSPRRRDDLVRVRCHTCRVLVNYERLVTFDVIGEGRVWLCPSCVARPMRSLLRASA
jgi:hypothetical protein